MRVDLQAIAAKACFHKVPFPILDALAAVAPAIKAAALERAAVACSELEVHSTSSRNPGIKRKIKVGPAVAAIIRALKETT